MRFLDDEEVEFLITRKNDTLTDWDVLRYNNPCVEDGVKHDQLVKDGEDIDEDDPTTFKQRSILTAKLS